MLFIILHARGRRDFHNPKPLNFHAGYGGFNLSLLNLLKMAFPFITLVFLSDMTLISITLFSRDLQIPLQHTGE